MMENPIIRNQSIDLQSKSLDWFLYDRNFRHERVKIPNTQFHIRQFPRNNFGLKLQFFLSKSAKYGNRLKLS